MIHIPLIKVVRDTLDQQEDTSGSFNCPDCSYKALTLEHIVLHFRDIFLSQMELTGRPPVNAC